MPDITITYDLGLQHKPIITHSGLERISESEIELLKSGSQRVIIKGEEYKLKDDFAKIIPDSSRREIPTRTLTYSKED